MQPKLQPLKKTVPDPFLPEMGGSSQKWRAARAIFMVAVVPHRPARFVRSIPQLRGHRLQV
jgi:hypothetical protein